ncbi:hypothetical protein LY56_00074 [Roseinatronobacter thiooxidans]|uniref:Uncharacterized protein n=1 Tax=Roseinatronobacter thiooxidans TaxID=121821 RepID=A0A2W7QW80_9RHOB|nr:hypothetical protein [Roseinatronobacter thiooxidans]PZX47927.1 hypothetical protein LY56_00074 [Roseinatronobacter thiooxidans]
MHSHIPPQPNTGKDRKQTRQTPVMRADARASDRRVVQFTDWALI